MADQEDLKALLDGDNDLAQRDLREADLSGQNLIGRNFEQAYLQKSNFSTAVLRGANFNQAKTLGMIASNADMSGIKAPSTVFHGVNLRGANLSQADLNRAHFTKVDLSETDLRGANFKNSVFNEGTTLDGATTDSSTLFDGASIFRPLARQEAFRFYKVERGKLVRRHEPITEEIQDPEVLSKKSAALNAIAQVEAALQVAVAAPSPTSSEIGIGHNGPPSEAALSPVDIEQSYAALQALRIQIVAERPDTTVIARQAETLGAYSSVIGKWAVEKADLFATEFVKSLGKEVATAKFWVGAWLIVSGQLSTLLEIITRMFLTSS